MRYLLFAGNDYYLKGGVEDFKGFYDSVEDAKNARHDNDCYRSWADITDASIKIICRYTAKKGWVYPK